LASTAGPVAGSRGRPRKRVTPPSCRALPVLATLAVLALPTVPSRTAHPPTGRWQPAGKMSSGRYAPAAVRLRDGRVLVAGGYSFALGTTLVSADLFDPRKEEWQALEPPALDRNFAAAVLLRDGSELIAGGF